MNTVVIVVIILLLLAGGGGLLYYFMNKKEEDSVPPKATAANQAPVQAPTPQPGPARPPVQAPTSCNFTLRAAAIGVRWFFVDGIGDNFIIRQPVNCTGTLEINDMGKSQPTRSESYIIEQNDVISMPGPQTGRTYIDLRTDNPSVHEGSLTGEIYATLTRTPPPSTVQAPQPSGIQPGPAMATVPAPQPSGIQPGPARPPVQAPQPSGIQPGPAMATVPAPQPSGIQPGPARPPVQAPSPQPGPARPPVPSPTSCNFTLRAAAIGVRWFFVDGIGEYLIIRQPVNCTGTLESNDMGQRQPTRFESYIIEQNDVISIPGPQTGRTYIDLRTDNPSVHEGSLTGEIYTTLTLTDPGPSQGPSGFQPGSAGTPVPSPIVSPAPVPSPIVSPAPVPSPIVSPAPVPVLGTTLIPVSMVNATTSGVDNSFLATLTHNGITYKVTNMASRSGADPVSLFDKIGINMIPPNFKYWQCTSSAAPSTTVGTTTISGPWVQVETSTPRAISSVILSAQKLICNGQEPRRILIAGSSDGATWTQLFASTSDITWDSETKTFTFQNTTAYRYVRLIITITADNLQGSTKLTELEYFYTPFPITVIGANQGTSINVNISSTDSGTFYVNIRADLPVGATHNAIDPVNVSIATQTILAQNILQFASSTNRTVQFFRDQALTVPASAVFRW